MGMDGPATAVATDDRALLAAWAAGEEASFTRLVERHRGLVCGVARALVGDAGADDVAQAVFLLLARRAKALVHRDGPLADWLLATCRRVAANHRRAEMRRRRREARVGALLTSTASVPGAEPPTDLLLAAVVELPEALRTAVILHHLEGGGRAEVAARLGISSDALEKRLQRALTSLRAGLARRGLAVPVPALLITLAATAKAHAAMPTATLVTGALKPVAAVRSLAHLGTPLMTLLTLPTAACLAIALVGVLLHGAEPSPPVGDPTVAGAEMPLRSDGNAAVIYLHQTVVDATVPGGGATQKASAAIFHAIEALRDGQLSDARLTAVLAEVRTPDQWRSLRRTLARGAAQSHASWDRDLDGGGPFTLLPDLSFYRTWARQVVLDAEVVHRAGDWAAARDRLVGLVALGRHLGRDTLVMSHLAGYAVEAQALTALLRMQATWPEAERGALADNLAALPAPSPLSGAVVGERAMMRWFERTWRVTPPHERMTLLHQLGIQNDQLLALFASINGINIADRMKALETHYDPLAVALDQPMAEALPELDRIAADFGRLERLLFPSLDGLVRQHARIRAVTVALLAVLRRPAAEDGELPELVSPPGSRIHATLTDGRLHLRWLGTAETWDFPQVTPNRVQAAIEVEDEAPAAPTPTPPDDF